jgi:hypothetical protein
MNHIQNNPKIFEILRKIEFDHSTEISKNLIEQSKNLYPRRESMKKILMDKYLISRKIKRIIYYSWIFLTIVL